MTTGMPCPRTIAAALAVLLAAPVLAAAQSLQPPLGLDTLMPVPGDNPLTPERVALGRRLFLDPILSADRVPKLLNRGYGRSFFWDGRIRTLEEQVLQPVTNTLEMDLELVDAVERLRADGAYASGFHEAFGRQPNEDDLARALASYVRTILSGDSRYDRYVAGDANALDPTERLGLEVFRTKGNCVTCHLGPNLTDERFHNTGVGYKDGRFGDDGRFTVTGLDQDRGAFKTPTLRNVAETAPYMHDGSIETLEDVIDDYDEGGTANPYLDREMTKLALTESEKAALAAFLKALSGRVREGLQP